MSLNFLIEHDRHGKIPTRITVYDDVEDAEERLYRLEDEQEDELHACLKAGKPVRMEYVILGAASVETIKRTHGRYFGGSTKSSYQRRVFTSPVGVRTALDAGRKDFSRILGLRHVR